MDELFGSDVLDDLEIDSTLSETVYYTILPLLHQHYITEEEIPVKKPLFQNPFKK